MKTRNRYSKWPVNIIFRLDRSMVDMLDAWRLGAQTDDDERPMSRSAAIRLAIAILCATKSISAARQRLDRLLAQGPPRNAPRQPWDID